MTALQSIRLLQTQTPPTSRPGSAKEGGPSSATKKYEPWNDIQFGVDAGLASASSPAGLSLSGGASDTAAIAPWMVDDGSDLPPHPPPRRNLFSSSKTSLSKAGGSSLSPQQATGGSFLGRHRGGSEASSSYALAANGVNGTPVPLGTQFDEAWGIVGSGSTTFLPGTSRMLPDPYGSMTTIHSNESEKKNRSLKERGMDFARVLKKKASKVGLAKPESSDDGHSAQPIPPLPYPLASTSPSSSGFGLGNPFRFASSASLGPPSPTQLKEKKKRGIMKLKHKDKDHDHGTQSHSSDLPIAGDPEITLDTDLDRMEGIIDLNKSNIRPLGDLKAGQQFGSNLTTTTTGGTDGSFINMWDDPPASSSFGTSDGGNGSLLQLGTAFIDPWATPSSPTGHGEHKGHTKSLSGGASPLSAVASGKRRVQLPIPPTLTAMASKGKANGAMPPHMTQEDAKDPAWHAPESWDVDKVGPDAPDYSSDEDMNGKSSETMQATRSAEEQAELDDFGIIETGGPHSTPMQPLHSQQSKGRLKSPGNMFSGIGMISGIAGGSYGITPAGVGRLRTKSDAYAYIGLPGSSGGVSSSSGHRKESWPVDDDLMSRRPSEAQSSSTAAPKTPMPSFHLRVYRTDGTYHIVECPVNTTAHDLSHVLRKKLLLPGQHYKLHLRERGRERVLGQQERPVNILRRRLEQAGYDETDNLEHLGGDDLSFLLRFVFRDANITAAQASGEDDVLGTSSALENIDLTGRGLLTIPIALHRHASTIVVLNLSKNPHIDIPLDFIADCKMLRDLRLSHAAMKAVPGKVKHISTLHWLDISSNRMVTLDDADLHKIPDLREIQVQNNRLSNLPGYFAQMRALKFLNISNNKFDAIPTVLREITTLRELDVSFNNISIFPPELGALVNLERLVMVGNRIDAIPLEIAKMVQLKELDCRRNLITDLTFVFKCPSLEVLRAESNMLHGVEVAAGSKIRRLCVNDNERLSTFTVQPLQEGATPYVLEAVDVSKCMLSSLDGSNLALLTSLITLSFDHNNIRTIPDAVCELSQLELLSASNNRLDALPDGIGKLTRLRMLNVHNNNIVSIPASIWNCRSLVEFNASSNVLKHWAEPVEELPPDDSERKTSVAGLSGTGRQRPPLADSLERLYLADNRLEDDIFHPLMIMQSLQVLNLSFNDIYELPPLRLPMFSLLRELYLGGNKLSSLPGEDLHRLYHLRVLFLNANKLQTLPSELTKVKSLECLDVGNNVLKYNIANWQFDWNWNFNRELRYLNLSGNKRLEIKNNVPHDPTRAGRAPLTDFSELTHLRLLGLMDVTLSVNPVIPDETEDRRVRTSPSEINGMSYGIADTLGMMDMTDKGHNLRLSMFDIVRSNWRGKNNESLFGMFGRHVPLQNNRSSSNRLTKFLQDQFLSVFTEALKELKTDLGDTVSDALRRAFLGLNKAYYESLQLHMDTQTSRKMSTNQAMSSNPDLKNAACGLVVYITDNPDQRVMYVANVGNIQAVVSRKQTNPMMVSTNHDPFDREETSRIRAAEGWVSPKGTVNDELEISRSFGAFHLLPAVNAHPSISAVPLTDEDEFVIIANRGLWDHVSPKTAVDIARLNKNDPMIAAQRLRDYAMSYGAQGSTMVMVIAVGELFHPRVRQPALDLIDMDMKRLGGRRNDATVRDRILGRLDDEVPPPVGNVALVFTDIRNSTSLWEKNPGMPSAMKLHNGLLRRHLRNLGGYEVKTEGDAFMVSFQSVAAALLWCLTVQVQLIDEEWPAWILDCEDGKEIRDADGTVLTRGLSVRMGIHWGAPNCEPDPVTGRMDYLGTVVNRASRVSASAKGGHIAVSSDVVREIMNMMPMDETKPGFLTSIKDAPLPFESSTIEAIQRMGLIVKQVGEVQLKGIEMPELLSLVYPYRLQGRLKLLDQEETVDSATAASVSRGQSFNMDQIKSLAMLCIRVEALASDRVFRPTSMLYRNYSLQSANGVVATPEDIDQSVFLYANPELLMPTIRDNASDADLLQVMESLSLRIENALSTLANKKLGGYHPVLAALEQAMKVDRGMLLQALAMFNTLTDS